MYKQNLVFVFLLISMSERQAFAQVKSPSGQEAVATLHFYQNKAYGLLYPKFKVYANGKLLCKLGRNSHCQVTIPVGTTAFTAKIPVLSLGPSPALTLILEAGKSYYLQGDLAPAGVKVPGLTYGFTEVVPNEAKLAQLANAKHVQPLVTVP